MPLLMYFLVRLPISVVTHIIKLILILFITDQTPLLLEECFISAQLRNFNICAI